MTVDGLDVRLMYGSPPFFLAGSQLQMDVKGMVFLKSTQSASAKDA